MEDLENLDKLSSMYKAYVTSRSATPSRIDAERGTTNHQPDSVEGIESNRPDLSLGRYRLDVQDTRIIEQVLLDEGLSKLHKTVQSLRERTNQHVSKTRISGSRSIFLREQTQIEDLSGKILSRIWETSVQLGAA
jgi:hypothetical protein